MIIIPPPQILTFFSTHQLFRRLGDGRRINNADSHNRLFGEVEQRIPPTKSHSKSNIPFGDAIDAAAPAIANGKSSAAASNGNNGNGVASIVHATNGNGNGHHHAAANGNGSANGNGLNGNGHHHHEVANNGNGKHGKKRQTHAGTSVAIASFRDG